MSIHETVRGSLERSIELYRELVTALPETALAAKLPVPSNTIGRQLWCVVGARESYSRALRAGKWSGFRCSLDSAGTHRRDDVLAALETSGADTLAALAGAKAFTDVQNRLVVDLLEHEAAHHGQLIRYLYGLRLPIPDGWKARYALD